MTMLGTDLLIGGTTSADDLALALGQELDVEHRHIFQAAQFTWEEGPPLDSGSAAYVSALGTTNTILMRELDAQGDIGFIVELELLTSLSTRSLQRLADRHGLVVGLSRDIVCPNTVGTAAAEGYVLFRAGLPPVVAVVLEDYATGTTMTWGILDTPVPPLPDFLFLNPSG